MHLFFIIAHTCTQPQNANGKSTFATLQARLTLAKLEKMLPKQAFALSLSVHLGLWQCQWAMLSNAFVVGRHGQACFELGSTSD